MIETILFFLGLILFLFLPGRLLLHLINKKFSDIENIIFSVSLGIPFLTLLTYLSSHLQIRFLVAPILLLMDLLLIFYFKWRPKFSFGKINKLVIFIVFLGSAVQSLYMLKSGLNLNGGISFWGVHGYDAVWHLALINEMLTHFPAQNPGFSGELLKNYHYLTDLFYAQFSKMTFVSPINLYFRFGPILVSLLLNSLIYFLVKKWSGKISIALWSIFFVSISGSFGWIPPLFGKGSNNWETAFWSMQTPSSFLNPPFAFSLMILTLAVIFLFYLVEGKNRNLIILTAMLLGSLFGFKIYAGIISLGALAVIAFLNIFKKNFSYLFVFLLSIPIALVVFLPSSSGATGFLVWEPWWFIKTMVEAPDRLNWSSLELRRQVYVLFENYRSLFLLQAFLFVIFFVGNLGTRIIGVPSLLIRLLKRNLMDLFLILLIVIAFLPPIFFVQKSVPWNSIQFIYYFVFFFSFFAAESMIWILGKLKWKILKIIFALIIIGSALPSTIETLYWFNAPNPTTLLENKEVEALEFLKNNSSPDSIILTFPFDYTIARSYKEPPVPMTYYNSPYVSFFSQRRIYLEDLNAATMLEYPLDERLKKENQFFQTTDIAEAKNFLKENKINYIYLADSREMKVNKKEVGLEIFFDKGGVRIFKVSDIL